MTGSEQSDFVEVTLRIDRRNLDALTTGKVATVYTWLAQHDDGTFALLSESPYGEMAYQSQVNHQPGSRFASLTQQQKDKLAEQWAAVRDGWGTACEAAMRGLYEKDKHS